MKKAMMLLSTIILMCVVTVPASATLTIDSLNWMIYDDFIGPSFDNSLFHVKWQRATTYDISSGLLISSEEAGYLVISTNTTFHNTDSFAMKFPYQISGSPVLVGMNLTGLASGTPYNIIAGILPGSPSQGEFGFIYNGSSFFGYANEGVGWYPLFGAPVVPRWTDGFSVAINVNQASPSPFAAFIQNVQIASVPYGSVPTTTTPVPEPSSILLMGLGLLGFAALRWKLGKS